jgi:hypothetical protein
MVYNISCIEEQNPYITLRGKSSLGGTLADGRDHCSMFKIDPLFIMKGRVNFEYYDDDYPATNLDNVYDAYFHICAKTISYIRDMDKFMRGEISVVTTRENMAYKFIEKHYKEEE